MTGRGNMCSESSSMGGMRCQVRIRTSQREQYMIHGLEIKTRSYDNQAIQHDNTNKGAIEILSTCKVNPENPPR